jgi:transcriptional regulator with XRE-family HTH domain
MAKGQRAGQRIDTGLLLRARLRKGWTLRDVSQRCEDLGTKVAFAQISQYERDVVSPTPRTLLVLAQALDLTVDELLADRGDEDDEDALTGSAA